jgi:hypothetical protein
MINEEKIRQMMFNQMQATMVEVANFCADMADANRGQLSLGDMIRKQFKLDVKPQSKVEFVTTPTGSSNEFYEKFVTESVSAEKKCHLRLVKKGD